MPNKDVRVNSRKYDQSIRRTWKCELIEHNRALIELVGVFSEGVAHTGLGQIKKGTISREYYWLDRWYNIFRFHEPNGGLRNYYCNIAMPPTFENGVLDYIDLDIDVVVWPDFRFDILDREDFEKNALKYGYTDEIREKTEASLDELIRMIDARDFPFSELSAHITQIRNS